MTRHVVSIALAAGLLTGCGLAGVGGAAAVNAEASAKEAKAAQQQMDKVRTDVDNAQKTAADARAAAEAAAQ